MNFLTTSAVCAIIIITEDCLPDLSSYDEGELTVQKRLHELWYDEEAVVTVEYALLLSVLVVGMAGVWQMLRAAIADAVADAADAISSGGITPSG